MGRPPLVDGDDTGASEFKAVEETGEPFLRAEVMSRPGAAVTVPDVAAFTGSPAVGAGRGRAR